MDFSHVFNLSRWNFGLDGRPLRSAPGSGHGTGDVGGPGWAGWGAGGGSI